MRRLIWIVVIVVILGLAGWRVVGRRSRASAPAPQPASASVPVEVTRVTTRDLVDLVSAGGTIEATDEVVVTAKLPGRVVRVSAGEGDAVGAGQVLVRQDTGELSAQLHQAQAGVDAARARLTLLEQGARPQEKAQVAAAVDQASANYETAKASYERMRMLFETGAVSQAQLDAAKLQMDVSRSQLEVARQQQSLVRTGARPEEIEMARAQVAQAQAAVSLIQVQIANTTITSPIAGIVTHRGIEPGEMAAPGIPLFTVAKISAVYAVLDVSETDLGKVRQGQPVSVRVDSVPGRLFQGTVRDIAEAGDPRTRVFKVKALVANTDRALKPAMFARGEITVGRAAGAVVIPRDAVSTDAGKPSVFVVEGGVARTRTIQVGRTYGPLIRVLAGLKPGESVVIAGQSGLTDGTTVSVR
ncbi:MAG TPA: efflux RND transporter periplasmic adaptor subunit [bacterium]